MVVSTSDILELMLYLSLDSQFSRFILSVFQLLRELDPPAREMNLICLVSEHSQELWIAQM